METPFFGFLERALRVRKFGVFVAMSFYHSTVCELALTCFFLFYLIWSVVGAHSVFYTPVEVDEYGFGEGLPTTMPVAVAAPAAQV